LAAFPLLVSAQSGKTLDLSTEQSRSSFYVVLASRGGSAMGHAFVVWGMEDGVHHRTTVRALGLYPEGSATGCSGGTVRTVPGGMLDELKTHSFQSIDQQLIVRVDRSVYQRSWQLARQWDCRHEYSLFRHDCVEFVRAVGESLGLDMPRRTMTCWAPQAYLRAVLEGVSDGDVALKAEIALKAADGR
jgi:hypothetical protein